VTTAKGAAVSIGSAMRAPLHDITYSVSLTELGTPALTITTCKQFERALSPMVKACEAAARTIANTPRAKRQRSKIEHAKALCMTYSEQLALVTPEATSAKQKPTLQQPPGIAWHVSSNAPNIFMSYPRKKGTPIKS
jgi:hypothetical protein